MAKSYTELVNEVEGLKIWREEAERIAAEMSQWIKRFADLERELEMKESRYQLMGYDRGNLVSKIEELEDRILDLEIANKELEHKLGQERDKAMYHAEQHGKLEDKYTAALAAKRWADKELESWRKGQLPPSEIEVKKLKQQASEASAEREQMRVELEKMREELRAEKTENSVLRDKLMDREDGLEKQLKWRAKITGRIDSLARDVLWLQSIT